MLDLFAGLGGASNYMKERGWVVETLDLNPKFKTTFVMDIHDFHPTGEYDLIWASPPCIEFSTITKMAVMRGERGPQDPLGPLGMGLVVEAKRVIDEAKTKYWVVENVIGSKPYISKFLGKPKYINGSWLLWGNFPLLFGVDKHPLRKNLRTGLSDGWKKDPNAPRGQAQNGLIHPHITTTLCHSIEREMNYEPKKVEVMNTIRVVMGGKSEDVLDYETAFQIVRRKYGEKKDYVPSGWNPLGLGKSRQEIRIKDDLDRWRTVAVFIRYFSEPIGKSQKFIEDYSCPSRATF